MQQNEPSDAVNDPGYPRSMARIGPYDVGHVLGGVGSRAGVLLAMLGQDSMRQARAVLAEHNLRPRQLRILDLLADRGPVAQRELGELMGIDHSILVGLLNPLEAARLVTRQRDSNDRRRHVVTITTTGKRRLAAADHAFREAEDKFFAPLTDNQRDQLLELLLILRDAQQPQPDDACD